MEGVESASFVKTKRRSADAVSGEAALRHLGSRFSGLVAARSGVSRSLFWDTR